MANLIGRREAMAAGAIAAAAATTSLCSVESQKKDENLTSTKPFLTPAEKFTDVGFGGPLAEPVTVEEFTARVRETLGSEPLVFAHGPERVERAAVVTGGAGRNLRDAAGEGYDLFLTGEAEEPSLHTARELGIHFVAAGHYATERIGIQALAKRLAEQFDVEWKFIDLPNPV